MVGEMMPSRETPSAPSGEVVKSAPTLPVPARIPEKRQLSKVAPPELVNEFGEEISPCGDSVMPPPSPWCNDVNAFRHGSKGKFQKHVIERFRQEVLQKYLSLHDAFARLNHDVSRDRKLWRKDFTVALQRLGMEHEDTDELFHALDTTQSGSVSLSSWLHALVDVSPKALLWELRCRLLYVDIQKHDMHKVLEFVQWPQHGWQSQATKLKRRTARRLCNCIACARKKLMEDAHDPTTEHEANKRMQMMEADFEILSEEIRAPRAKRPSPFHLRRGDWLKFCTSICLTLMEAERLFNHLTDSSEFVDLRKMFEILRQEVTPDVSLERFATKVVALYDTFDKAFQAFTKESADSDRTLRWDDFKQMSVALTVNDDNASKLWDVLLSAQEPPPGHEEPPPGHEPEATAMQDSASSTDGKTPSGLGIAQSAWVRELSLWAPQTAVEQLAGHICERFGNLAEGRRALTKPLSSKGNLSPKGFSATLRSRGIRKCDVERVLTTVAQDNDGSTNLEATINTLRVTRRKSNANAAAESAQSAVRNETLPLWQQLREVQDEIQYKETEVFGPDYFARKLGTDKQEVAEAAQSHKFVEAVHGAVKTAESRRLKSVLHSAKKQVEQLEERWASAGKRCPMSPEKRSPSLRRGGPLSPKHGRHKRALKSSSSTPALCGSGATSGATSGAASGCTSGASSVTHGSRNC